MSHCAGGLLTGQVVLPSLAFHISVLGTSVLFHNIYRPLSLPDPSTLFREEVGGDIAITKVASHLSKQQANGHKIAPR